MVIMNKDEVPPFLQAVDAQVELDMHNAFRAGGGLTLGELVAELRPLFFDFPDTPVKVEWGNRLVNIENLGSYRGDYQDLAIEPGGNEELTAEETYNMLHDAIGRTYEGYKGGDFTMDTDTHVWVSHYGDSSGFGVTGVVSNGQLAVITTGKCDGGD
jgi:hypothetical protein